MMPAGCGRIWIVFYVLNLRKEKVYFLSEMWNSHVFFFLIDKF